MDESILINGIRFSIKEYPGNEMPRQEDNEFPLNSHIKYFEQIIMMRRDMHQDKKKLSILHHLINYPLDRYYFYKQMEEKGLTLELFCSRIAAGLYSVFRDNVGLLKSILIENEWYPGCKLVIHGKGYIVIQVDQGDSRLNDRQGCIFYNTQEIFINKQLKIDTRNITLLHEIIHGVICDGRILEATVGKVKDKWEIEEPVIEILSTFLFSIIKENPVEFERWFFYTSGD